MRGSAIHIAMPGEVVAMRQKLHNRIVGKDEPPARQPEPFKFLAHDGREIKRPAIQGLACRYNTAFTVGGKLRAVLPGGFTETKNDTAPKRLLFDHDDGLEYGNSASGLEFATCPEGLAFRMPLKDDANGRAIYNTVMRGERPCVSIGGEAVKFKMRKLDDGTEYQLINECGVDEISLCEEGAVRETFVAVVDLNEVHPWLWAEARTAGFDMLKAASNITARAGRVAKALKDA